MGRKKDLKELGQRGPGRKAKKQKDPPLLEPVKKRRMDVSELQRCKKLKRGLLNSDGDSGADEGEMCVRLGMDPTI